MKCDSPIDVQSEHGIIQVACGNCPPCKRKRTAMWVFRLSEEDKISSSSHFVTLTYTADTIPITKNGFRTLDKKDLQKFFKRLRKLCTNKIKYYAVGEYGTKNKRPHYHAIIFNVDNIEYFAKAWNLNTEQIGNVHVGKVEGASITYTMKYIDKPTRGKEFARDDRQLQFAIMSKGLGKNYITQKTKKYHTENLDKTYLTQPGGIKIPMPRYYKDKIFDDEQKEHAKQITQDRIHLERKRDFTKFINSKISNEISYYEFKESQRRNRYKEFYKNQKSRDT